MVLAPKAAAQGLYGITAASIACDSLGFLALAGNLPAGLNSAPYIERLTAAPSLAQVGRAEPAAQYRQLLLLLPPPLLLPAVFKLWRCLCCR